MPEAAWLSDAETLTYLHACISTKRHRVRVPDVPMYLDAFLVDELLVGGLAPRLGSAHLRVLSIMGFPAATYPGILDELNRLAFPYRWSTRAICLDKTDATMILTRIRRQWFAKRKSVAAILKEVVTNEASALLDSDAHNKALDADAALQELGADVAGEAYVTATLTVWDENPQTAHEKLRLAEKVIQSRDFTCIAESVNAVEAWLGSLPGHVYANVRQPRRSPKSIPEAKEHIWSTLSSLASAPLSERTLTGFAVLLQSGALKQPLRPYCLGGPYGRLLDAETERLGQADVQAFETEGLIGTGAASAVLAYLFHRIEGRLDGRPPCSSSTRAGSCSMSSASARNCANG